MIHVFCQLGATQQELGDFLRFSCVLAYKIF